MVDFRIFEFAKKDGLREHLVRGAFGSAGLQAVSRILALALAVILARILGPDGYGIYAFAVAIMSLLLVVAEAGVPTLLMREVAAARGCGDLGLLRGTLRRGFQMVAGVSVLISIAGMLLLVLLADRVSPESFATLTIMLFILPAAALIKTIGHALRGLDRVLSAQTFELLLWPAIVLILVSGIFFVRPELQLPSTVMAAQFVAVIAVAFVIYALLIRALPADVRQANPIFRTRQWLKSALPFIMISGALAFNSQIDIIMLGWFSAADEIGVYRVAVQGAMLVGFSLQAVSAVVTPHLSRLHAQEKMALLQHVVTKAAQAIIVPAIIITIALIVMGTEFLVLVFGSEFSLAYQSLIVLVLGQFAVAFFGISGPLLSMSGFEKQISSAIWLSAIANVIINLLLIPRFGALGAAISTTITQFAWIIYLAWFSSKKAFVSVSPFYSNSSKTNKIGND